jgi:hypothetical protein
MELKSRLLARIELPNILFEDIGLLATLEFNKDYAEYAVGCWETLPLFNRDGDKASSRSFEYNFSGKWTAYSAILPAIVELIKDTFVENKLRSARIFSAKGEGLIRPHRDYLEFTEGFTRIHCVLQTNASAMNGERNKAFHMPAGSIWFLEGREPHWAVNFSGTPRYHLVCDFFASSAPEECLKIPPNAADPIEWKSRPLLTSDVVHLIDLAARLATRDALPELLDVVNRIFVRYECNHDTPYQMLLEMVQEPGWCRTYIEEQGSYFLGPTPW